ncbi:amidohydrolase family protein [Candidatus Omnitrophota bacterium]
MKIKYILATFFLCSGILLGIDMTLLHAQTRFERMDSNNDGWVSQQEYLGKPFAFNRMDRNGDGYISSAEAEGTPLNNSPTGGKRKFAHETVETEDTSQAADLIYIDTHNHLIGWVKNMNGQEGGFNCSGPAEIALAAMNKSGVRLNLVMPMPQDDEKDNKLIMDYLLPVMEKYPGRFAVLGGGGSLNVMIQEAIAAGGVTDGLLQRFDNKAAELVYKGAVGFGEMTAEHFSMGEGHHYESAPPDHLLFLRLADLAAKYDIPIDIHMEAIPEEMGMPARFKSPNPSVLTPNIAGFERLLAHNRNARIIWVHLGWDNTGRRTVGLTRKLMQSHPNLYMSIRIASGMQKRPAAMKLTFPLDDQGNLKEEWLDLFNEFPDRFVIGSDEIVLRSNKHPSAGSVESTVHMLEQLPDELRRKIGHENARRLYRL